MCPAFDAEPGLYAGRGLAEQSDCPANIGPAGQIVKWAV